MENLEKNPKTEKEVLAMIAKGEVFQLNHHHFGGRFMTKKEMIAIFNCFDAFWQYTGVPCAERPHAMLKSEKHSNGFIACREVLDYVAMCVLFGNELSKHIRVMVAKTNQKIDVIASSAYSAINIGYETARALRKDFPEIQYKMVEKDKEGNPTILRGGIDPRKSVLIINELMTTPGGSTWETKQAVMKCNGDKPVPNIIGVSFVLVHRAKEMHLADGSSVIPAFHFDMEDFNVPKNEECPYCKAGSTPIKPKVGNNWNIIHGRT